MDNITLADSFKLIVISILTLCNHRSDDSGRLSFLRTRTLGDRIRDTRTWARNRRQSQEKEANPQEAGGQEAGGQVPGVTCCRWPGGAFS